MINEVNDPYTEIIHGWICTYSDMRALYANSICAATDVETFTNQALMTFMDKITLSQTLNIWLKYLLKNIY